MEFRMNGAMRVDLFASAPGGRLPLKHSHRLI